MVVDLRRINAILKPLIVAFRKIDEVPNCKHVCHKILCKIILFLQKFRQLKKLRTYFFTICII